jgi:ABC-type glycerol-3-phosphate transport system permease component
LSSSQLVHSPTSFRESDARAGSCHANFRGAQQLSLPARSGPTVGFSWGTGPHAVLHGRRGPRKYRFVTLLRSSLAWQDARRVDLPFALFIPFVTPALPTSIIWLWIFNPQYGFLNYLLGLLHLPALGWVNDPALAMPSVIIYSLWQSAGFNTVIFLAGLTTIAQDVEEAARVDGASGWAVTRYVTLPLLTPTIFFVFIVSVIESLKVFTQIFALTGGGPAGATTTVGFFLYQDAFQYFHEDTASAVAVILFGITLVFCCCSYGALVDGCFTVELEVLHNAHGAVYRADCNGRPFRLPFLLDVCDLG